MKHYLEPQISSLLGNANSEIACQHIKWARMLLSKNAQLKKKLKFLAINEKVWKDLNETNLTPGYSGGALSWVPPTTAVVCELNALEDVKFHS